MEELAVKCNGFPMMFVTKLHRYTQLPSAFGSLTSGRTWRDPRGKRKIIDGWRYVIVPRRVVYKGKKNILRLPDWICVLSMIAKEQHTWGLPESFLEGIWFFREGRNSSFNYTAIAGKDGYIGLYHRSQKKSGASFKWSPIYIIQQTFKASL